ncbi:MAG: hypothetical protein GKR90_06955 [Pseudomonadales bacterium]|nr:hypothetical protein [Pseudomonadales bacterium]
MYRWHELEHAQPELAATGVRLLAQNEVAFLATVSASGRPRLHPFVPKICRGRLVAFIIDSSPKARDLALRKQYSIHAALGAEDEEFFVSGSAGPSETDTALRNEVALAMGFATRVDDSHRLFEFRIDRALWTRWLDFGTPNHRAQYVRWNLGLSN